MKILHKSDAVHVDKAEGSSVDYYLFPEYEVHYNEIKPGTVQTWHHHSQIWEVIFVTDGEIEAHWEDKSGKKVQKAIAGDLIEVEDTPHTFINTSEKTVRFVVFRFVPNGNDVSQVIKNDKILDQHL